MRRIIILTLLLGLVFIGPARAIAEPLGGYQLPLSSAVAESNAANAVLAARIIDGTIINPTQIFSFDQIVGPRSAERGFIPGLLPANNGQMIYDYGSGICMTASILHQAVKAAGLEVLERHNHIHATPYLPPGEDAAIWAEVEDYKFKNTSPDPVMIIAEIIDEELAVRIFEVLPTPIAVFLDEQQLSLDVQPVSINGRMLVPVRTISENLGADVFWDGLSQTVTARKNYDTITLAPGSRTAMKNGTVVPLDIPAGIINDRMLVPLRFVSEALGASVNWNENERNIKITSLPAIPDAGLGEPAVLPVHNDQDTTRDNTFSPEEVPDKPGNDLSR